MDRTRRRFLGLGAAAAAGLLSGCSPGKGKPATPAPLPSSSPPPALPPPISAERLARRRGDLAARMREEGIDLFLATPSASFTYLTGASLWRSERLIALVMEKDGSCRCLGPAFEKERLLQSRLPGELDTWQEEEDPIPLLAALLSAGKGSARIAVEGSTWYETLAPLARRLPAARLSSATPLLSPLRMKKDPDEIALMQAAVEITLRAINQVMMEARVGDTEEELLGRAAAIASAAGATLEGMVQFGPKSAIPHAGSGKIPLRAADVILFDLVAEVHGYHSDISRTFAFGQAPSSLPRFQAVYQAVRRAQEEGFRTARPGIPAGKVDEAARAVIRQSGYGPYFTHRLGHGLGLEVHEEPYLRGGNEVVLEEGMTVTVEPGIYLPGEFGIRLEDDLVVGPSGPRILSAPAVNPF